MKGLSIVVTYYKGEAFIFKCLSSIFDSYDTSAKLMQYEVILVLDSMDDAYHIEKLLKEQYKGRPLSILKNIINVGVSVSRNIGLKLIKYNFYTIIDQDDYVKSNYFQSLEEGINIDIGVHILNGTIREVSRNIETPIYFFTPFFKFKSILLKNTIIYTPGLLIFNTNFISPIDLFIDASEKYKGCDDWAAYLNRLVDAENSFTQKFLSTPVFVYYLHSTNYSNNRVEMISSSIAVLDYLSKKTSLSDEEKKDIGISYKMHKFYFDKDVTLKGKINLFLSYPGSFLSHYFLSFFNIERLNRLIYRIRNKLAG